MTRLIMPGVIVCSIVLSATASFADPQEDFAKCVDAYVVQSIKSKPSLVDFTIALDKLCTSEATILINSNNHLFAPTGNAALDALSEDTKLKLQQTSDRYVKNSIGGAVAYYSKLQENWRKAGIETR
jgi:hypothetical protein